MEWRTVGSTKWEVAGDAVRDFRALLALTGATALTMGVVSSASAVTTDYHPDADSRSFADSAGGWTATTEREELVGDILCLVAPLFCPSVDNDWASTGGVEGAGDGYLRTEVGGLANVLTRTTVTWRSPTFAYNGAAGAAPDEVFFTFDRRTDAGSLIELLEEGYINIPPSTSPTATC